MSTKAIRIVIILAAIALIYGIVSLSSPAQPERPGTVSEPKTNEYTYVNDEFDFSVLVPAGWSVYEVDQGPSTLITLYKNEGQSAPIPSVYSSEGTHVSILPLGFETGGMLPWKPTAGARILETATTTDYKLTTGSIWAKKLDFKSVPASWRGWGFIFAAAKTDSVTERCMLNGSEIPVRECNPLSGAVLERSGTLTSSSDMQTISTILRTFTFTQ